MSEWISTKERMPDRPDRYLVHIYRKEEQKGFFGGYNENYIDKACWTYRESYVCEKNNQIIYDKEWFFDHCSKENIIAWAEWPQPPEVKDE